jgi:hypothetical protein
VLDADTHERSPAMMQITAPNGTPFTAGFFGVLTD